MSLPHVNTFRDLIVYGRARELQRSIFGLPKKFPKVENHSLTDQIRRSSRSVGAQIAESWAKRRYEKHFISKLTDAIGELNETEHWIETAEESEYIDTAQMNDPLNIAAEARLMLSSMISKSDKFCTQSGTIVRESDIEDFLIPMAPKAILHY